MLAQLLHFSLSFEPSGYPSSPKSGTIRESLKYIVDVPHGGLLIQENLCDQRCRSVAIQERIDYTQSASDRNTAFTVEKYNRLAVSAIRIETLS
jgi:hypothetical protein